MRNKLKFLSTGIILLIIAGLAIVPSFAETIYTLDGFQYTLRSSTTASLYGVESDITDVTLPNSLNEHYVTEIDSFAFQNKENLASFDFSGNTMLEKIGMYAFDGCTGLSGTVTLNARIQSIGFSAFEGCSSLNSARILSNLLKTIPDQCFYRCSSLSEVTLPDNLEKINKFAFAGCTSLTYVEIPVSVNDINRTAFADDPNLTLGVYFNSYAYQYAKDNNIPYVFLDTFTSGDVNRDGVVDVTDATHVQLYAADLTEFDDLQLVIGDLNSDGIVDISDATQIQRIAADME